MDGVALGRALESATDPEVIRVIALTARGEADDRIAGVTVRTEVTTP